MPEPLSAVDQLRRLALAEAEAVASSADRQRAEEGAQARGAGRPPRPASARRPREGGEAGRRHPDPHRHRRRPPRRRHHPGDLAAVDPAQPVDGEEGLPGPLRLDRGADPLQPPQPVLPELLGRQRPLLASLRRADSSTRHRLSPYEHMFV